MNKIKKFRGCGGVVGKLGTGVWARCKALYAALCICHLLQQRVGNLVVKEVHFSPDDAERFERDLEGTWEACGVNSTLLFARCVLGDNMPESANSKY